MCPTRKRDPRTYVQSVPLPVPSQQAEHIVARSDTHYKSNCSSATKEEVFKTKYARRTKQVKEQGYQSVNYKPYQLLGEPLYLEERKLILHSLGQNATPPSDDSSGSSSNDEDEEDKDKKDSASPPQPHVETPPPRKFVLRRNNKKKKSLSKEITSAGKMVNWVKLGHGVFPSIRKEDKQRLNAEEIKDRQEAERRRREWQPANLDSSDSETEDGTIQEGDLSASKKEVSFTHPDSSLKTLRPPEQGGASPSDHNSALTLSTASSSSLGVAVITATSFTTAEGRSEASSPCKSILSASPPIVRRRRRNKSCELPRPYTPIRANINRDIDEYGQTHRDAIFRQLCVLNWILEAMITEPPAAMDPITKCWSIKYKDLRHNTFCKTTVKDRRRERLVETRWDLFVTNPGAGHLRGRASTKAPLYSTNLSFNRTPRRSSIQLSNLNSQQSTSKAPSVSLSSNVQSNDSTPRKDEDQGTPGRRESFREQGKGTLRLLDDIYESASVAGRGHEEYDDNMSTRRGTRHERSSSVTSEHSGGSSSSQRTSASKTTTISQQQLEERDVKVDKPGDRQIHTWVATTNRKQRAMSAPPINEYKPIFPSHKHIHLPAELRNRFADVTEDKALMLHDKLEVLEKKKLWRSEEKFRAIRTNLHISAQLEKLKEAARDKEESAQEKMRRKEREDESKWFQELVCKLPNFILVDRACSALVEKLQNLGVIESRKITPQKFLNVLAGLKPWELCLPDVSAAVEFVRERVVLMSIEDFESWYQHEIPSISRSQSAPPNRLTS